MGQLGDAAIVVWWTVSRFGRASQYGVDGAAAGSHFGLGFFFSAFALFPFDRSALAIPKEKDYAKDEGGDDDRTDDDAG